MTFVFALLGLLFALPSHSDSTKAAWTLTWSDEFNALDGTAPDPAKWTIETGGNG